MPEKTAEVFVNNPAWMYWFGDENSKRRIYRTGDLVKYNTDLSVSFIGRVDNQVKLNGMLLLVLVILTLNFVT